MQLRTRLALLFLLLLPLLSPVRSEAACTEGRCKQLRKAFELTVRRGEENYCYWELKKQVTGNDFHAISREILEQINDQTSMTDYYLLMRRWAAAFHDGHVNYLMNEHGEQIKLASAGVRFELQGATTPQETLLVSQASAKSGLKSGDVILQVGRLTPQEAIAQALYTQSGSTPVMRRYSAARRLVEILAPTQGHDSRLTLEIERPTGDRRVKMKIELPYTWEEYPGPDVDPTNDSVEWKILDKNIGYLKIRRFSKAEQLLVQAMDELTTTDALIIDVRGNGGGDQSGNIVLERLTETEIDRYSTSARLSDDLLEEREDWADVPPDADRPGFSQWKKNLIQPAGRNMYLGKKVVVLTDPGCFSACDTFASALQQHGLATVIGSPTGGGTGTPLVQVLPDLTHEFRYSVIQGRTAISRELIEGRGTSPDLPWSVTPEERAQGIDSVLNYAIGYITGKEASGLIRYQSSQSLAVHPTILELMQQKIHCPIYFKGLGR